MTTDWHPMTTAPRDGTRLLLVVDDQVVIGHYYLSETYDHQKLRSRSEGWHCGMTFSARKCEPTKWQYLPAI